MVDHFTFEVEGAPPTLNEMLKDSRLKRGVVYNQKKKDWEWIVRAAIARPWPKFAGAVAIEFVRGWCGTPCDMDNVSPKYILDALVRMGVIRSDDPTIVKGLLIKQKRYPTRDGVRSRIEICSVASTEQINLVVE